MPGGIDVHTHLEMPFGGTFSADDFETGTRAAAWGGTTTIVDFAVQKKGTSLQETLDTWHGKAGGKASIDYGFHMIVSDVNARTLKEMDVLVGEGVTSFKMFMAYPGVFYATDGEILQAMQKAAGNGATIMMHAENGIAIDALVAQALEAGHTDPGWHGRTRPPELEGEATSRAIRWPRWRARRCTSCTCPPGRPWTRSPRPATRRAGIRRDLPAVPVPVPGRPGRAGVRGRQVRRLPAAAAKDHWQHMWRGLRTNDLSVVSTDHCPFCFKEQKELGRGDFSKIPNGIPGIEHRIDLLHQGVVDGELSLARWVEVNVHDPGPDVRPVPAQGHDRPRLGRRHRAVRPVRAAVLSAPSHHMAVDYSAYEGREVQGQVDHGDVPRARSSCPAASGGRQAGRGRFLPRGICQYLAGRGAMDIGLVLQNDPPAQRVIELARRADASGYSHVWTFDSHVLWQEPFVIYSQILAQTSRVMVGPLVTNPLTRDPSVTASLFATLNDTFGNRTVCGIGRGDSALRVLGRRPASLAVLSRAMRDIRDLAEGRSVDVDGTPVRIPWVRDGGWRSGWPDTGRRRCGCAARRPTASSCSAPTRTSRAGRSARSARPRPRRAATRTT